ncbi:hypothetical protein AM1_G0072 (plasmid) [Acaryochloris marina MBIC11017]|uniref:Uncharacterized protein n=1 Tax=Acaryochloris marina (strain MBIC 11017) TaxID=329726 RepID=A8ZQG6_ACAM1|nr:hypothetical protein AM1_G0072 [Acaryochloris marina MBIC11017]
MLASTPDISTHLHLKGHPAYVSSVAHLQGISVSDPHCFQAMPYSHRFSD